MKNILTLLLICLLFQQCAAQSSVFELSPAQSMSITGKGPGQDAAYNPFGDGNSVAIVKNISINPFRVRIQREGEIIEVLTVNAGEIEEVKLRKGDVLYLDSRKSARADVSFRKDK